MSDPHYIRPLFQAVHGRLAEPRRLIQVIAGPRQVGKTTLTRQVIAKLGHPYHYVSADEPTLRDRAWLSAQWEHARLMAANAIGEDGAILVVDEAQKIVGWSEVVKRLWDEDSANGIPLRVVLLGSAPLLLHQGLTESLAGRFEILRVPHWTFPEMRDAFGFTLDQYIWHGGYPGAAPLIADQPRWRRYILDGLVETTISRDVLLLARVDKPALLRRLFELGCRYSGQVLSFNKMLGQIQDAGNTTTLAHYLELLSGAGMLTGVSKFTGQSVRARSSSPKFQVFNTALMTAQIGISIEEAKLDQSLWGRVVESAIGAHLVNAAATGVCEVFYWRERNQEVDFVLRAGSETIAIEVKSARTSGAPSGLAAFSDAYKPNRTFIIGPGNIEIADFLERPVESWFQTKTA